jgi:transcriptional regulator with XRE-family HTH domain
MKHTLSRGLRETVSSRMRELMSNQNVNPAELAQRAGMGETYVYDLLASRNKNPSLRALEAISSALNCSLAYLLGDTQYAGGREPSLPTMPIVGAAEAGTYRVRAVSIADSDQPQIHAMPHPRYPRARHMAVRVEDDSLEGLPHGVTKGMLALVLDAIEADLSIESGRVYLLQRLRSDGTIERAFWQAQVFRDRIEFSPVTRDQSRNRAAKFTAPRDLVPDRNSEVFVEGLYYGAIVFHDNIY